MKINSTVDGTIVTLEIEGSLSSEAKLMFDNALDGFIDTPVHCILDLTNVTFIDSTAIGSIVKYYSIFRSRGRHLLIAGINKQIYEVFNLTGINRQITIFDSPRHARNFILGS